MNAASSNRFSDEDGFRESSPSQDDATIARNALPTSVNSEPAWAGKEKFEYGSWRHALGITCLLTTVVLWTASNFLASTIFADNTYSKPYLVTYLNTAFFVIPLVPMLLHRLYRDPSQAHEVRHLLQQKLYRYTRISHNNDNGSDRDATWKPIQSSTNGIPRDNEPLLGAEVEANDHDATQTLDSSKLTIRETARLALEFCILWFAANYFVAACLEHTTVASSTILTSTSSIWTLIFGSAIGVERFTLRKLGGVLASLVGIILISGVDLSGKTDENRGSFPHKTPGELAFGNAMAVVSAVLYGVYAVMIKKRIGDESRVNVALFFGLVGIYNVLLLWPGIVILHYTGVETFELFPTRRVAAIILMNSTASLVSDISWALAMLFTSPLLVTVGLSLTIPLSLIGEIVLSGQYSSWVYWLGAFVVFLSFIFINHEESRESTPAAVPVTVRSEEDDAA